MKDRTATPRSADGATGAQPAGAAPWFLQGGGISGATARACDWSGTPLGPPESWPSVLKTTVATMFAAQQPMFLWWGEELTQIYNDAYLPSFGAGKHPRAMGQAGRDCWGEIWSIIFPQIEDVMQRKRSSWHEDALIPIHRNGRIEEVYWSYSYSPVFCENGTVGGTLVICTETTQRVQAERRAVALHTLANVTATASDAEGLMREALSTLQKFSRDVPCVVVCERDPRSRSWKPVRHRGLSEAKAARLSAEATGALAGQPCSASALVTPVGGVTIDETHEAIRDAYVAPLSGAPSDTCIVFGVHPRVPFDEPLERFLNQVTSQLQAAAAHLSEVAQRAAVEAERRNLLEQAPVATALMVGPDHVFELANQHFRAMFGRPDIVGKRYLEAFPEVAGTPFIDILSRVYHRGESFATDDFVVPIDKGNGVQDCTFKFNLEPVRTSRGEVFGMMAIAVEITDQVSGRRALERAHEEREGLLRNLEEASRAKDEFLAMLGHELRNPLSPIVTALQLMRSEGATPSREQRVIERQVQHLIRLVDDLLDVAKIARGKVELRRELVDLHDIVIAAAEVASDLLEQREHRLTLECDSGRLLCFADRVRITQVVANLLTNAARYTERGGHIRVRADIAGDSGDVFIEVSDNGNGITAEMLPKLFTLFEQERRSADRAQGGLGIGLSLVKNLSELHGGRVAAHSDGVGRGSTFTVWLPAAQGSAPPPRQTGKMKVGRLAQVKRRVLVVDDNVDAAELLAVMLERAGHEAVMSSEPLDALEVARQFQPEVAILDIGLPVIDGYELAQRLRRLPGCERCRTIALSGYGQQHDRERSRAAGFEAHLTKPVPFDSLLERIDQDF